MQRVEPLNKKVSDEAASGSVKIRCNNDHTLLFVAAGIKEGQIETVCRKCKQKRLIKFPVAMQAQA
jgi:hypothetical protein